MPLLIDRQLTENKWVLINPEEGQRASDLVAGVEHLLIPYALIEEFAILNLDAMGPQRMGIQLNGDDDIGDLATWLPQLSLIAIEFPVFRDGRGFSLARQIRRLGYQGELRAVGHFGRDQLGYLERCGFNAFDLAEEKHSDDVFKAFDEISYHYQGAADDPRPLYRQEINTELS